MKPYEPQIFCHYLQKPYFDKHYGDNMLVYSAHVHLHQYRSVVGGIPTDANSGFHKVWTIHLSLQFDLFQSKSSNLNLDLLETF